MPASPADSRAARIVLAALFCFLPFYATLSALDAQRPAALPEIFPRGVTIAFAVLVAVAFACAVWFGLRTAQTKAVRYAYLSGPIANSISALFGFDPAVGLGLGLALAGICCGSLALSVAGPETTRLCVRAFLWSALAGSLLALGMLVTHRPASLYEFDNARAVGTFLNPNELAAYALVALGLSLPLAIFARNRLAIATSLALLATLALTYSRWGILSAAVAAFAFAFAIRSRRSAATVAAIALIAAAFTAVYGAAHHNPVDSEMRDAGFAAGWNTFVQFPLLGVGPLSFSKTYLLERPPFGPGPDHPVAYDPHSVLLSFAASGGMLAVVVMFSSAWILMRRAYDDGRAATGTSRYVALGIASAVLGLVFDSATNTISLIFPLGYQATALAMAVARNELE